MPPCSPRRSQPCEKGPLPPGRRALLPRPVGSGGSRAAAATVEALTACGESCGSAARTRMDAMGAGAAAGSGHPVHRLMRIFEDLQGLAA